jgi:hypothetical protein
MVEKMRYVQTDVSSDTYSRLVGIARSRGTSLKEQMRRALEEFIVRYEGEPEKDSIFSLIGSHKSPEGDWSTRKDWRP